MLETKNRYPILKVGDKVSFILNKKEYSGKILEIFKKKFIFSYKNNKELKLSVNEDFENFRIIERVDGTKVFMCGDVIQLFPDEENWPDRFQPTPPRKKELRKVLGCEGDLVHLSHSPREFGNHIGSWKDNYYAYTTTIYQLSNQEAIIFKKYEEIEQWEN